VPSRCFDGHRDALQCAGLASLYQTPLPQPPEQLPEEQGKNRHACPDSSDDDSLSDEWQPQPAVFADWQRKLQAGEDLHVAETSSEQEPTSCPQPQTEMERCCCMVFEDLHKKGCAMRAGRSLAWAPSFGDTGSCTFCTQTSLTSRLDACKPSCSHRTTASSWSPCHWRALT
jgi:hypothetical protein